VSYQTYSQIVHAWPHPFMTSVLLAKELPVKTSTFFVLESRSTASGSAFSVHPGPQYTFCKIELVKTPEGGGTEDMMMVGRKEEGQEELPELQWMWSRKN
jgi:hypothetical protein